MPDPTPPTLEDLARAAVAAWDRWMTATDYPALARAMSDMKDRLANPEPSPTRALDYMLSRREQVELRFACALVAYAGAPPDDMDRQSLVVESRRLARLLLDLPQPTPEAVRRDDQIRAVVADLRGHRDTCGVYDCTFTHAIPYAHRAAATAELAKGFGLWWDSWIEPKLKKIDEMLTPA